MKRSTRRSIRSVLETNHKPAVRGFNHRDRPEYDYCHGSIVASENARSSSYPSEDRWSCVVVVATFCVFVSMTLILGLYGTTNVWLGRNSPFLIKPTSMFVQSVIVEELGNKGSGVILYRLNQTPKLDVLFNWSEVHSLTVPNDSYKSSNSLKDPASKAYAQVFVPHHGWAIRKAVALGMYALPTRAYLFSPAPCYIRHNSCIK